MASKGLDPPNPCPSAGGLSIAGGRKLDAIRAFPSTLIAWIDSSSNHYLTHWKKIAVLLLSLHFVLEVLGTLPFSNPLTDDETQLSIRFAREYPTRGWDSTAYLDARGIWHAPLGYAFWSRVLPWVDFEPLAGRMIASIIVLLTTLEWIILVRRCIRDEWMYGWALVPFLNIGSGHHIRSYGLYGLLGVAISIFAADVVAERGFRRRLLSSAMLVVALVGTSWAHIYGLMGPFLIGYAGLFLIAIGSEAGIWLVVAGALGLLGSAYPVYDLVVSHRQDAIVQGSAGLGYSSINGMDVALDLRSKFVSNACTVSILSLFLAMWLRGVRFGNVLKMAGFLLGKGLVFVVGGLWLREQSRESLKRNPLVPVFVMGCMGKALSFPVPFENYLYPYHLSYVLCIPSVFFHGGTWGRRLGSVAFSFSALAYVFSVFGTVCFGYSAF